MCRAPPFAAALHKEFAAVQVCNTRHQNISFQYVHNQYLLLLLFFDQGKTSGGSKITRYLRNLFGSEPTLAGRHQRNHHAAKPN